MLIDKFVILVGITLKCNTCFRFWQ